MSAQWPKVLNYLLTTLPNLPGWGGVQIFDGPPVSVGQSNDYVLVGYVSNDQAGAYTLTQDQDGFQWGETGEVRSELVSLTGSTDLAGMRSRVFALMDALEAAVRADRTLGGALSPTGTADLVVDVLSSQSTSGASQSLTFALHYYTLT